MDADCRNLSLDEEAARQSVVFSDVGGPAADRSSKETVRLAALPVGARLILQCRQDWRVATVISITLDSVILSVGAPSGRTYRVRRPPDSPLSFEGSLPLLGEGPWRAGLVRYDTRW